MKFFGDWSKIHRRADFRARYWQARLLGRDTISISYRGVRLELPVALYTPAIRRSFEEGYYELLEYRAITGGLVRPGDRVLECGAAVGFLTCVIARRVAPGRLLAVEANPELISVAQRSCALNGVSAELRHGLIASAGSGAVCLDVSADFWGSREIAADRATPGRSIDVPVLTLAELIRDFRPSVLVVDIEDGEGEVFDDVDLAGVERVLIEIHPEIIGVDGVGRLFRLLDTEGFVYSAAHSAGAVVAFVRA